GAGRIARLRLVDDEEATLTWEQSSEWAPDRAEWQDEDESDATTTSRGSSYGYRQPYPRPHHHKFAKKRARRPDWKRHLAGLRGEMQREEEPQNDAWPAGREILYVVDVAETLANKGLMVEVAYRQRKKDGAWSKPKPHRISREHIDKLPDPED